MAAITLGLLILFARSPTHPFQPHLFFNEQNNVAICLLCINIKHKVVYKSIFEAKNIRIRISYMVFVFFLYVHCNVQNINKCIYDRSQQSIWGRMKFRYFSNVDFSRVEKSYILQKTQHFMKNCKKHTHTQFFVTFLVKKN